MEVGCRRFEHVGGSLAGQVGQVHCILQLGRSLCVNRIPNDLACVEVARCLFIPAQAGAGVGFFGQPPFAGKCEYSREEGDFAVGTYLRLFVSGASVPLALRSKAVDVWMVCSSIIMPLSSGVL